MSVNREATVTKIGKRWFATFQNEQGFEENVPINLNLSEEFLGKTIGIRIENNKIQSIYPIK